LPEGRKPRFLAGGLTCQFAIDGSDLIYPEFLRRSVRDRKGDRVAELVEAPVMVDLTKPR
jgi:hypothetical protein